MRRVYLGVAVIGAIAPIVMGAMFVKEYGLDGGELVRQVFGTRAGALTFTDLFISTLAFWAWLATEGPRIGVRRWPYVVANVFVGLSFALPLFLYVRSGKVDRSA